MHKDQYTDAPSQEQVRVKTMLNSTISMGYPDNVSFCLMTFYLTLKISRILTHGRVLFI